MSYHNHGKQASEEVTRNKGVKHYQLYRSGSFELRILEGHALNLSMDTAHGHANEEGARVAVQGPQVFR